MRLYDVTAGAKGLAFFLEDRFADHAGQFEAPAVMRGVWLSDRPLLTRGMSDFALLAVDFIHPGSLWEYESPDDGKGYREWRVPADVIQKEGTVSLLEIKDDPA